MIFSLYVFLKAAECGFTVTQQKSLWKLYHHYAFIKEQLEYHFFVVDTIAFTVISYSFSPECK